MPKKSKNTKNVKNVKKNVKQSKNTKNGPLILEGTLASGVRLTMYGENHLDIDNAFYENLPLAAAAASVILVEHSTNSCEIADNSKHLFQAHAKGTEWVFYTQKTAGHPHVVCFDTRAEHGYLNAFEELELSQVAERLPLGVPTDIRFFVDSCMRSLGVFEQQRAWFESVLPGYFERSFPLLEAELRTVLALLKWRKTHGIHSTVLDMPLAQLLPGVAAALVANLRRVASVSVDINLRHVIEDWSRRPGIETILVFAGKNHVVRMLQQQFLDIHPRHRHPTGLNAQEEASIEVEGDIDIDRQIIAACSR